MRWFARAFGGGARGPRELDASLREALLAVLDRDLERAEELLGRALRFEAGAIEPYMALARLYRMRGESGRAIRVHQNLLLRRDLSGPTRTALLADLAADFRQAGFLRRAIAAYEEVLARDSHHRGALSALVELLAQVREHRQALHLARRLAKLERRDASAALAELEVEMAEAAQGEGRSDTARRAVRRALRRDRHSVRGWLLLGSIEAERGRPRAALAAWARVPEIDRQSGPLVYPRIEATYAALDRARDYEAWLRGLLEARPDDAGARLALARTLAGRGEGEAAVAELRNLLDTDPEDLEARAVLGRLLLAEGSDVSRELAELLDVLEARGLLRPQEKLP